MKRFKVSIVIPSRNEDWLSNTVEDILSKTGDETEVRIVLDGTWPVRPVADHPRLTLIHLPVSIGQRAAINLGVRGSRADFVCKCDAHVSVDQDFSNKLIADYEPGTVVVPRLYNLHVFDFECSVCKTRTYQGPTPTVCNSCKDPKATFSRVLVWQPRWSRRTDFMKFDEELKFGYWGSYGERPEVKAQGDIADTMSLLGACFFTSRRHYWDIDGCDEGHGGWGAQGTEMSLKAHLFKNGRLRVNKKVFYSHLFRTSVGFSFPYTLTHQATEHARNYSRDFWFNNRWPKASRLLSQVVEQYWPIPGWSIEALDKLKASEVGRKQFVAPKPPDIQYAQVSDRKYAVSAPSTGLSKGIVYYTENRCPEPIFSAVQNQLKRVINGHQLVSVSLKPLPNFGDNLVLGLERGYLTMFQQILAGLSLLDTDLASLAEHDCLYSKEHLDFIPPDRNCYWYNENIWRVSAVTGHTLFHYRQSALALVADRRLLIDHYRERIARIEKEGFTFKNGFEPGTRSIRRHGYDDIPAKSFFSARPIVDIRDTGTNLTLTNWKRENFRYQRYTAGWTEGSSIPGWPGVIEGRFNEWLAEVSK